MGNQNLFLAVLFFLISCHRPPGREADAEPKEGSAAILKDEPASSPQSIKVLGVFIRPGADSTKTIDDFIVSRVLSLSSSLTYIAGTGDTLQVLLSPQQKLQIQEINLDKQVTFQLILQERQLPNFETVIYSVKDLRKISSSK